jgi:hypothetical protein
VIEYDPLRHHNKPSPELWIDSRNYMADVRELITELRRLNDNLERKRPPVRQLKKSSVQFAKHANKFLDSYAGAFGKGAAALTTAAIAAVLYQTGVGKDLLSNVLAHVRLPK